ncbi:MAG: Hsp20/alpha crystallin family protein [Ignavibacteriales bacterium]|nr:Hsp20/alpha crystallin family protein [Ignavibacteriales bacterium]
MTLMKFEPIREMESLHERFGRMFENFPFLSSNFTENFSPRIDISETDDKIVIESEISGLKKEDLKITLQDNIITIEGEKKKESEDKGKTYIRNERIFGSFKRCFTLPTEVDNEKVDASFENGMLKIELTKKEPVPIKTKEIKIK